MIIAWFGQAIFSFVKCKGELRVNYRLHCRAAEIIPISPPLYLAKWVPPFANRLIIWNTVGVPLTVYKCECIKHTIFQSSLSNEVRWRQERLVQWAGLQPISVQAYAMCHSQQELQYVQGDALRKWKKFWYYTETQRDIEGLMCKCTLHNHTWVASHISFLS